MNSPERALRGLTVGVSISESENSGSLGFPGWQVNRTTLQVVSALFGQGVGVVFGHDWRDDGVMEAVHGFAQQIQPPVPLSSDEAEALRQPLMRNILPWPDIPRLSPRDVERLTSTLRVERAELPAELSPFAAEAEFADPKSDLYRYVRARGLTHLRLRLEAASAARLCIGGRRSGYAGRYPGIVEEALFALRASKLVYFAGLLGGAADDVINAIEGKAMPREWCLSKDIAALYANPPIRESDPATHSDREIDPQSTWSELRRLGRESASNNGLRPAENEELFHTPVLDRVVQLVLTGLSRFCALG